MCRHKCVSLPHTHTHTHMAALYLLHTHLKVTLQRTERKREQKTAVLFRVTPWTPSSSLLLRARAVLTNCHRGARGDSVRRRENGGLLETERWKKTELIHWLGTFGCFLFPASFQTSHLSERWTSPHTAAVSCQHTATACLLSLDTNAIRLLCNQN